MWCLTETMEMPEGMNHTRLTECYLFNRQQKKNPGFFDAVIPAEALRPGYCFLQLPNALVISIDNLDQMFTPRNSCFGFVRGQLALQTEQPCAGPFQVD